VIVTLETLKTIYSFNVYNLEQKWGG